jgi:uracil-DNA glycosylase family 4
MSIAVTKPFILVPPEGSTEAKIAIIGEAPCASEVSLQRPLVGPAGNLLNQLLHAAGITRAECYLTNVIKEQPHANDLSNFITFKGGVKTTSRYDAYEKQLLEEVSALKCNVILALGNVPLYALTRLSAVGKRRGSILQASTGHKVIPTYHPNSAMWNYLFQYPMQLDLRKVKAQSLFPEVKLPSRNLRVGPTYDEALGFLADLQHWKKPVTFDIEVVNLEVSCISLCSHENDVMSIPFVIDGRDYYTPEQEAEIWLAIAKILEDPFIEKQAQNMIFDSSFLFRKYGIQVRQKADTMIGQYLIAPELPKGLDFITSIYTDEPYYKDEGKKHFKVAGDYRTFWYYNAKDSAVCHESLPKILTDVKRLGNMTAYKNKIRLIEPLIYMQEHGILVDVEGMKKASVKAGEDIQILSDKLNTLVGYEINSDSPKQLCDYFYNKKKFKPYFKRGTSSPTTDEKALKRLKVKGSEEASLILQLRKLGKLKGTYYDVKLDEDNRLRCSFNPVGTKGERVSSSKSIFGTGGNFQNIPKSVRKYLIADPGKLPYNVDLSQAENRNVAYIAPDLKMINTFEAKIDLHRQTASLIFGKPIEDISDDDDIVVDPSRASSIGGGIFSERFWGKKANHGLNYGLGYRFFAMLYEISEAEAKFIVERYHAAYPGVRQYHEWVRNQLSKDRTLEDCYGRRRLFLERWGEDLFKEAYSFIPQSSVATKINLDGLLPLYENQASFAKAELLNQVHDSITFQVPLTCTWEEQARMLVELRNSLESPMRFRSTSLIIPADCSMGLNLKDQYKVDWHKYSTTSSLAEHLEKVYSEVVSKPATTVEVEEDEEEEDFDGDTDSAGLD